MPLGAGDRLGPYEILSALGAGGMGEVYRATDTNLGRQVAIKVLPDAFAQDPERVARFEREAKTLASLNHPNIAIIHGLEKSQGTYALVMELVEGEDLSQRIARGPIPIDEALPIAKQIAEALEAAHEQGIIHRDLKPANIKVKPDGTVKVLDFGLAKLTEAAASGDRGAAVTMSPTITSPAMMTGIGVLLGTAAYMSPEQAKGREADKRSDIWGFGCVLFEMLTGKRTFDGEDVTDVMVAVLSKEPNWAALPANVPAPVRTLLRRCLEKDRKRRLDSAAAARLEIDEGPGTGTPTGPANLHVQVSRWRRAFPWAVALGAGLALVLTLWAPWRTAAPPAQVRLEGGLGADVSLAFTTGGGVGPSMAVVLSPDGQTLAFVGQKGTGGVSQLYVRRLDQLQARLLSGSDDASSPFFSPDGQWIAFFAGGKLKKISVTGGAAVALCDAPDPRGGVWADAGTIVFQPIGTSGVNLMRVSSAGGKPEPLTTLADGEATQRYPQVLPGGKAVLFTSNSTTGAGYENANIVVQPLPSGPRTILQRGGYYGRYLPSGTSVGHLVYIHDGTLFAAPFDLDRLELAGQAVPAIEHVTTASTAGSAQFAASDTGTLVYVPGQSAGANAPISWMDHTGKATSLRATAADWSNPHFSPDGRRLAIDIGGGGAGADVWVYEWARDTLTRLTFDPSADRNPVWTPDGRRIVFASGRGDKATATNLHWQRADGTGEAQRLTESKNTQYPASWHPSGKFLAFEENMPQTGWDLMMLPMEGDEASGWKPGKPAVFLNSPANEREPMFSPDGRWLAYESNESGQYEVYVRPFPGPGGKWQISTGGGINAIWSRARRELFFETPDQHLMVAPYAVDGESFRADKPHLWSDARFETRPRLYRNLDLHPDGDRFALAAAPDAQGTAVQNKVVFIFNFFDELRRIAPVTKR